MKIAKLEDLHCDAGWRDFSFLKITTDDGLVGWSEYNESYGGAGITDDHPQDSPLLIGKDPRPPNTSRRRYTPSRAKRPAASTSRPLRRSRMRFWM